MLKHDITNMEQKVTDIEFLQNFLRVDLKRLKKFLKQESDEIEAAHIKGQILYAELILGIIKREIQPVP